MEQVWYTINNRREMVNYIEDTGVSQLPVQDHGAGDEQCTRMSHELSESNGD